MSFRRTDKACAVGGEEKTCTPCRAWRLGFLLAPGAVPKQLVPEDNVVITAGYDLRPNIAAHSI